MASKQRSSSDATGFSSTARPFRISTSIVTAADEFGAISQRGQLVTGVFEHPNGLVVVSVLSAEAILLVLVQPQANVGQLLFELRRNREHMASLV